MSLQPPMAPWRGGEPNWSWQAELELQPSKTCIPWLGILLAPAHGGQYQVKLTMKTTLLLFS